MRILYFAWLRERIGTAEETVAPPADVDTVIALLDWLGSREEKYRAALADRERIRVAVNQEYVGDDAAIGAGDEIAIFPPVTGG